MPWWWGKKEAPQPTESSGSGELPMNSEKPLPPSPGPAASPAVDGPVRFRVDNVYTIMGEGCVVGGEVVEGVLRPPLTMKLVTPISRPDTPESVKVVKVVAHRKQVNEISAGTTAGMTLRGLEGVKAHPILQAGSIHRNWPVEAGDFLVYP
jgi:GTPase